MYYSELCSYIYSLSRDKQLTEDIVQNVMLKIWKNREKLNINTSIKNYLYKSCYYELVDNYKRNKKELNYLQQVQNEVLEIFSEEEEDFIKKQIKKVQAEVDKLPPKCKEVFVLNKIEGLKYREVADQLGVSVKTVEAQLSKAMTRIREALEAN